MRSLVRCLALSPVLLLAIAARPAHATDVLGWYAAQKGPAQLTLLAGPRRVVRGRIAYEQRCGGATGAKNTQVADEIPHLRFEAGRLVRRTVSRAVGEVRESVLRASISADGQVIVATYRAQVRSRGGRCDSGSLSFRAIRWSGGPDGALWKGKTDQNYDVEMRVGRVRRNGRAFGLMPSVIALAPCESGITYIANMHNLYGTIALQSPDVREFPDDWLPAAVGPLLSGHPSPTSDSQFLGDFTGRIEMTDSGPVATGVIHTSGTRISQPPIGHCDSGPINVTLRPAG